MPTAKDVKSWLDLCAFPFTLKMLWIELALASSPKRPQVSVDPKVLAEKLGRSKATIGRLIG